jgi:hypothetical protein
MVGEVYILEGIYARGTHTWSGTYDGGGMCAREGHTRGGMCTGGGMCAGEGTAEGCILGEKHMPGGTCAGRNTCQGRDMHWRAAACQLQISERGRGY